MFYTKIIKFATNASNNAIYFILSAKIRGTLKVNFKIFNENFYFLINVPVVNQDLFKIIIKF